MGNNWNYIPFTEAVTVNPSVSLNRGEIYPFVEMKAVEPSQRGASESEFREFKGGGTRFLPYDTLMARITPCLENGKIARYIPSSNIDRPAFGSTEFIVIRGREGVTDNDYAYYLTQWNEFRYFAISQMTGSSGRQRVPVDALAKFVIPIPEDLGEQRAIAHILGSLDDKIELNRRMNQTLEAMARAIFKSWFVDFDPVRRNSELRRVNSEKRKKSVPPNSPFTISNSQFDSLFPDSFQDSELGPIPKGWKVVPLSEIINIIGGGTPKTNIEEYWNGDIPWFSVVDAPNETDVFVIDTEKHITQHGVENSSTRILCKGTTIISARGTVGKCALVGRPMAMNQSCYGLQGKEGIGDYFVYFTIRRQVADLQRSGHGSVFNTITRDTFKTIKVARTPVSLTKSYDDAIKPIMERILANCIENVTLASLRETLLPRLISGELRVPEIDALIQEPRDNKHKSVIYTIGHSTHSIDKFIYMLKQHGITALADVRSAPYSRFNPQFNKEKLDTSLKKAGITYVFLGKELGARPNDPTCYINGRADFLSIAKRSEFQEGLDRVIKGSEKYRVALMCAEKEPLDCHRTILVCRNLKKRGVNIKHILFNGALEDQEEMERRLLKVANCERSLFDQRVSDFELIERAYDNRAEDIAYKAKDEEAKHE